MNDVDLSAALAGIVSKLSEAFPDVNVCEAEAVESAELPVPALVCQIAEIEPDPDREPLTGQFPCMVRVQARIVLGHRTPTVRMQTLKLAGAVAAIVHNHRFGSEWGGAKVFAVEPDEFAPEANRFDVWLVEWSHAARLGAGFALPDEFQPTAVLVSNAPRIGLGNEAEYVEVSS
ncbi:hypothetical protein [Loktanella salsilacus]|uniref:hypothetical protein n=1 Tax=Loktanella salsilacus TaxID=195913 RepID=UPI00370373C9